jgi:putative transposase
VQAHGIRIRRDGRGRCHDHIFVERLWRTVKHEYLHLHAFETGTELRQGLKTGFQWYNEHRPPGVGLPDPG